MLLSLIIVTFLSIFCLEEGQGALSPDKTSTVAYVAEAKSMALEAKEILKTVMEDYKNKPFSPCSQQKDPQQELGCSVRKKAPSVSKGPENIDQDPSHHQILVFVSFSMPGESLKGLSDALEKYPDAKLVLRGLIDDSMEKTARRLQDVKGVMEINPDLFDRYQIEMVPTFVLINKGQPVAKLAGNISLSYAKEIFSEKGLL